MLLGVAAGALLICMVGLCRVALAFSTPSSAAAGRLIRQELLWHGDWQMLKLREPPLSLLGMLEVSSLTPWDLGSPEWGEGVENSGLELRVASRA